MIKFRNLVFITTLSFMCSAIHAQKIEHEKRFRALVIGMDGTKGVQFYQRVFQEVHQAPTLKTIADQGQYTTCTNIEDHFCAHTHLGPRLDPSYLWITSSGWAAVLTGVNTNKHLVKSNNFEDQIVFYQTSHPFPTFLSQLKQKGFVTAAGGVGNFLSSLNHANSTNAEISTGILDFECGFNANKKTASVPVNASHSCNVDYRRSFDGDDPERDAKLTDWIVNMIDNESPDVIMGVYDTIDGAGHHNGFGTNPGYMHAISRVDVYLARVIQVIQKRIATANEVWLILITSDHGGHINANGSGGHDKVRLHDEVIPFVIAVFGNHISLLNHGEITATNVSQMDVAPSVLHWFDIQPMATDGFIRSQYQWN